MQNVYQFYYFKNCKYVQKFNDKENVKFIVIITVNYMLIIFKILQCFISKVSVYSAVNIYSNLNTIFTNKLL